MFCIENKFLKGDSGWKFTFNFSMVSLIVMELGGRIYKDVLSKS